MDNYELIAAIGTLKSDQNNEKIRNELTEIAWDVRNMGAPECRALINVYDNGPMKSEDASPNPNVPIELLFKGYLSFVHQRGESVTIRRVACTEKADIAVKMIEALGGPDSDKTSPQDVLAALLETTKALNLVAKDHAELAALRSKNWRILGKSGW